MDDLLNYFFIDSLEKLNIELFLINTPPNDGWSSITVQKIIDLYNSYPSISKIKECITVNEELKPMTRFHMN